MPPSFSDWLERRGQRQLIGAALEWVAEQRVATARGSLLTLYRTYSEERERAEGTSAAGNIVPQHETVARLRWRAAGIQTSFSGEAAKDETTDKRTFGLQPSLADEEAGRLVVPSGREALPLSLAALLALDERLDDPQTFWRARRVGSGENNHLLEQRGGARRPGAARARAVLQARAGRGHQHLLP